MTHERPERHELPAGLRRPRSKNRFVDLVLDAVFSFTGPAQVGQHEGPPRGERTAEEARAGYGEWERRTVGGHTYLVQKPSAGQEGAGAVEGQRPADG